MRDADPGWENLCALAGSPERLLLVEFKNEALKPLTGKTLAEVALLRGSDPQNTILDLMRETTRMDRALRGGTWKKRMGWQLAGKRIGVVGFGRIEDAHLTPPPNLLTRR